MAVKTVITLLCCIELFMVQAFEEDSLMTESFDTFPNDNGYGKGVFVQSTDPNQKGWLRPHQRYSVSCGKDAVKVILPSGRLSEVTVLGTYTFPCSFCCEYCGVSLFDLLMCSLGLSIMDPVQEATKCGYSLTKAQGNNVVHVRLFGCHVTEVGVGMPSFVV